MTPKAVDMIILPTVPCHPTSYILTFIYIEYIMLKRWYKAEIPSTCRLSQISEKAQLHFYQIMHTKYLLTK